MTTAWWWKPVDVFSHEALLGSLCSLQKAAALCNGTLIPMALLNPNRRERSYLSGFIDIFSMLLLTSDTQSVQAVWSTFFGRVREKKASLWVCSDKLWTEALY